MNILKKRRSIPLGVKSALVYTLSTVFSRGLAIITVPIFTRLMSTSDIGVVNLYNSWYSMISVIATLSLTSGGFSMAMKEYENERKEYVSSVLSLTSIIAIIIIVIYMFNPSFWCNITGLSPVLMTLMMVGFLVAPARDFWLAKERYEYKYRLPGMVTMLSALAAAVLSVMVVYRMNIKGMSNVAEGRLLSNYFVIYGVAAVIWICIFIKGKTFINLEYWKFSLKLSIPLVGYAIASQILSVADRMMISKMIGNSAVGIYSTLYTVSSLSVMVWSAINASFVPYLYQNIGKNNKKIKKYSFELLLLYSGVAIILVLLAPEIIRILATKEYYEAIFIMPPIAAGVFFISLSNMYSNILIYVKDTKYIMFGSIIAAMLNIVLNMLFIPNFGYMAAAYTTLISYIVMTLFLAYFAAKLYRKKHGKINNIYSNSKLLLLSMITVGVSMLGLILYNYTILRFLVLTIFVVLTMHLGVKIKKHRTNPI